MKLNTPTTLAALVLIAAGGFMAGRVSSPASSSPASPQNDRVETRSSRGSASLTESGDNRKSTRHHTSEPAGKTGAAKDRMGQLESIMRGGNALDRNRALLAFIDQLGPGDFEATVAGFRGMGITDSRMGEYSLLLTAWAQADPLAALTYTTENTRSGYATNTVLSTWATRDPEAAIQWAKSNFDGQGANPYLAGIIGGISESDPTRATELLTSMPRSRERGQGLDFILPHLLKMGAETTYTWIDKITDESLRNGAIERAADQLAKTDPAGTVSWLIAKTGDASQNRLDNVYSTWAEIDSQAALNSLATLPSGAARSSALRGVISSVTSKDPNAAISLMDRYPNDVDTGVVKNFVWHSLEKDPAVAINQIARISDEGARNEMYKDTLSGWMHRDPAAAQSWIQANPVPESVQTHLANFQKMIKRQ